MFPSPWMDDDIGDLENHFMNVSASQAVLPASHLKESGHCKFHIDCSCRHCYPVAGRGVSRGVAVSRPSKNGGMRGSGEEGDPADVVVVVRQRAQPRVLVLPNLENTTCQRKKMKREEDRQYYDEIRTS